MAIVQLNMFAEEEDAQFIMAYVPEAELYPFDLALFIAEHRDTMAAFELSQDILHEYFEKGDKDGE